MFNRARLAGRRYPGVLPVFFITVLMTTSFFYNNQWGLIDNGFHEHWRDVFDQFIMGRLAGSRQNGIFSAGGLLLIGDTDHYDVTSRTIRHQYETYYQGRSFDSYWTYNSSPAFEGIVFGVFDRFTNFEPWVNVRIFRLGTSLFSGIGLSLILLWIRDEFGFAAFFTAAISIALSPWLILMGGSLYWQMWSLYLPFGSVLFMNAYFSKYGNYMVGAMRSIVFAGVLVKILFTGFEFITTVLVSVTVPFVYYSIRDKWQWKLFIRRVLDTAVPAAFAVLLGLLILFVQVSSEMGGYAGAYGSIVDALGRRAFGNPAEYSGLIAESLASNRLQVISTYLLGPAYGWGGGFTGDGNPNSISHLSIFFVFALSGGILLGVVRGPGKVTHKRKATALLAATWVSILAPLSWIIVFKAHAYIHVNLDYFVWQLPFMFLGFALAGHSVSSLFVYLKGHTSAGI